LFIPKRKKKEKMKEKMKRKNEKKKRHSSMLYECWWAPDGIG
jgi:hypothetical protein